jgi:hypothetical protein
MALYQEVDKTVDQGNDCDVFYRDCQCFLQFFMNPAQAVHLKKKDFLKSFANNSDKVENYMREDKLKPKNEADLIRIVEYYNTLAASD